MFRVVALLLLACASISPSVDAVATGLRAQYFSNTALTVTDTSALRTDAELGYSVWPPLSDAHTFRWDYFSIEWTGSIIPPVDGTYYFQCTTKDTQSLYLWIDDHFLCPTDTYTLNGLPMTGGRPYDIRAQYRHLNPQDQSSVIITWSWFGTNGAPSQLTPIPIEHDATRPMAAIPTASLYRDALRDRLYHSGWGTYVNFDMFTHVFLPDSFSLQIGLWDSMRQEVLQGATVKRLGSNPLVKPGYHSWSGSTYTEATLTWNDISITVTSTIDGSFANGNLQLLITPNSNATVYSRYLLLIIPSFQWSRSGNIDISPTSQPYIVSSGIGMINRFDVYASIHPYSNTGIPEGKVNGKYLAFPLNQGEFTVTTGDQYSVETVRATATSTLTSELASIAHFKSYGDDIYQSYLAMQTVLTWVTCYTPYEGMILPVSKSWDFGYGYVLFGWDSYFASYMTAYIQNPVARDIAYNTLIQITKERTVNPDGPKKSRDRTEPMVGSKVVHEIYTWYGDRWLLDLLYPDLLAWNTWIWIHRRQAPLGLITLGSDPSNTHGDDTVNDLQAAKYESGLDNSPMYDESTFDSIFTHKMNLYDVGFAGIYVMDCDALIAIATVLGKTDDIATLTTRRQTIHDAIQQYHWNVAASVYQNVATDTLQFSYHVSPTNFFPMLAGIPSSSQVNSMLSRWLTNETEMCLTGTCQGAGLPSITRSEPAYHEQNYWRGRIWGPQLQLMYWCLTHPSYATSPSITSTRTTMLAQARSMLLHEWRANGHVHENYNGDTGVGCDVDKSDAFYHWGALSGFISILEYVGTPNTIHTKFAVSSTETHTKLHIMEDHTPISIPPDSDYNSGMRNGPIFMWVMLSIIMTIIMC